MPAVPLYATAPTIRIDGIVDEQLPGQLISFRVDESIDGLFSAELLLHNAGKTGGGSGFLYFDRQRLDFGTQLSISAGAGDGAGVIFDGYVTALRADFPGDGTPRFGVSAEDRLQDLRMTRRTRTFEDGTDADAITTVANDHGLTPDIQLDGPTHRVLAQLNESDLAFVRRRTALLAAEVWTEGDTLLVRQRAERGGEPLVLSYGQNLRELDIDADLAHQRSSVTVSGWDVSAKEAIEAESSAAGLTAELDGKTSGANALEAAFAPRHDQLAHLAPATTEEAQAYADAEFARISRRFVTGDASVEGDARLRVGATVELAGVGPLFAGPYTVARVRHLYDVGLGYRAVVSIERPGLGA